MLAQFALAAAIAAAIALPSFAQDYPARPINLIVPFATGSGTDVVARAVALVASETLKT